MKKWLALLAYAAFTVGVISLRRMEFSNSNFFTLAVGLLAWLLGPPAIFLIQLSLKAAGVYAVETLLCFSCVYAAVRTPSRRKRFVTLLVVLWILAGLLPFLLLV